jgi:hypothetical protein
MGFASLTFARKFAARFDQVLAKAMIVDDLGCSGYTHHLAEAAAFVATEAPKYGLYPRLDKLKHYCSDPSHSPDPILEDLGYEHTAEGIKKYLGAPIGSEAFVVEQAKARALAKVQRATQLHRLQNPQLEFALLRFCVATAHLHLSRMLHPTVVKPALAAADTVLRAEFQRQLSHFAPEVQLSDFAWQLAMQPIKDQGGLGLQNPLLVSDAAFTASMAEIVRKCHSFSKNAAGNPIDSVASLPDRIRTSDRIGLGPVMVRLAAEINPVDCSETPI